MSFCSDKTYDFENKWFHLDTYLKEIDILKAEKKKLNNNIVKYNNIIDLIILNYNTFQRLVKKMKKLNCKVDPNNINSVFTVPSNVKNKPKNINSLNLSQNHIGIAFYCAENTKEPAWI